MAEAESLKFELLTDGNWGAWNKRMKVFLRARDLQSLADGSLGEPARTSTEANDAGIAEAERLLRKDWHKRKDKTVDYCYRTIKIFIRLEFAANTRLKETPFRTVTAPTSSSEGEC